TTTTPTPTTTTPTPTTTTPTPTTTTPTPTTATTTTTEEGGPGFGIIVALVALVAAALLAVRRER
ncbi:MAG: PGF-CTERM sorting domain-containing protein, partial [Haloarculaceae archaeon]